MTDAFNDGGISLHELRADGARRPWTSCCNCSQQFETPSVAKYVLEATARRGDALRSRGRLWSSLDELNDLWTYDDDSSRRTTLRRPRVRRGVARSNTLE